MDVRHGRVAGQPAPRRADDQLIRVGVEDQHRGAGTRRARDLRAEVGREEKGGCLRGAETEAERGGAGKKDRLHGSLQDRRGAAPWGGN